MIKNKKNIENIFIVLSLIFVAVLSIFFTTKAKELEFLKLSASSKKIISDREINILVLGIVGFDSRSPLLTDTIMVAN